MPIKKERLTKNFASIPNALFEEKGLSLDTIGVLVYLLSLPKDWEVRADHIRKKFGIGKDKQQRIFKELEDAGYLVREKVRGAYGRWITGITIHQPPQKPAGTIDGDSGAGFSGHGKSDTGENGPLYKTISKKKYSKNKSITNGQSKPSTRRKDPTLDEEKKATRSGGKTTTLANRSTHGDISWLWEG
ncbi:hypothetical protein [Marinobacter sp.]|uniref:hypothetical protein n=1 Tax=Marinobacter sp. TaxID=50741 RepID=UPI00356B3D73